MNLRILAVGVCLLTSTATYAQFSTPMRDVENPDKTAFRYNCNIFFTSNPNTSSESCSMNLGLPGKNAVIHTINLHCESSDTAVRFFSPAVNVSNSNGSSLALRPQMTTAQTAGGAVFQGYMLSGLRFVAYPQSSNEQPSITFSLARTGRTGSDNCTVLAHGYYMP